MKKKGAVKVDFNNMCAVEKKNEKKVEPIAENEKRVVHCTVLQLYSSSATERIRNEQYAF